MPAATCGENRQVERCGRPVCCDAGPLIGQLLGTPAATASAPSSASVRTSRKRVLHRSPPRLSVLGVAATYQCDFVVSQSQVVSLVWHKCSAEWRAVSQGYKLKMPRLGLKQVHCEHAKSSLALTSGVHHPPILTGDMSSTHSCLAWHPRATMRLAQIEAAFETQAS